MKTLVKKIMFLLISMVIFVGFQNFARIQTDPIERMAKKPNLSKEDILESEIDLKLKSLQKNASSDYLAKKCFETRVVCFGNRNHNKCLNDKITQYLKCSKLPAQTVVISSGHISF